MKIKAIKRKLKNEGENFVPDLERKVLKSVGFEYKEKRNHLRLKPVFAFSTLIILIFFGFMIFLNKNVTPPKLAGTIISIEINPAIELEIKDDKVVSIRGLNADGLLLLEDNDFIELNYQEVLGKILFEAQEIGFIDENSEIDITVINDNQEIENKITNDLQNIELDKEIKNKIKFDNNKTLQEEAKKYNISIGRMKLIKKALEANSSLKIKEALKYTVSELNEIVNNESKEILENVHENYQSSTKEIKDRKKDALSKLYQYQDEVLEEIKEIKKLINDNKNINIIRNRINILLSETNINVEENITKNNALIILDQIKTEFNNNILFQEEVINDKYHEQIKAFKLYERNNIKQNEFTQTFTFDDNFNTLNKQLKGNEKRAYKLINKIITKITVANKNPNNKNLKKQIDNLYIEYQSFIERNEVEEEFLESEFVISFEKLYNEYINNN